MTKPANIRGRILIVEDDQGVAHLQSLRLKRFGHAVTAVASPEEALRLVAETEFDLVILDYSLGPEVTGISLYMILREQRSNLAAVLVTGFEDPKIILQAMRAGIRDFIPKSMEYLDDLPVVVERMLRQVALEKEVAESASLRAKQEQIQAAFDVAHLAYWSWDLETGAGSWFGHHEELFGVEFGNIDSTYEGFLKYVHPEDRPAMLEAVDQARKEKSVFAEQFRIVRPNQAVRWAYCKGRFFYDGAERAIRMSGVVLDITDRREAERKLSESYSLIKALNDRLQLSLTEVHHRVKNNLQSVVSLLNVRLRDEGMLTEEDVKKIINHVQGLASLHDVLVDRAKDHGDTTTIEAAQVVSRLVDMLGKNSPRKIEVSIEEGSEITAKQGASLSLVVTELVSNALKHGTGNITVTLESCDEGGLLKVRNDGSQFPANFNPEETGRTGLLLLSLLCKTDFGCEAVFENISQDSVQVKVILPRHVAADKKNSLAPSSQVDVVPPSAGTI